MAKRYQHRRSVVPGTAPTALLPFELAVHPVDKKLWVGNAAGLPIDLLGNLQDIAAGFALAATIRFDIRSYGAVCDGLHDDGPAIQRAVNAATAVAGCVVFPALPTLVNTQVNLINGSVHLEGQGWNETLASGTRIITTVPVSVFYVAGEGRGSSIRRMSFQQAHPAGVPGWTPIAYPPTINIYNCNQQVTLDDLFCYNCYEFIRSFGSGRTRIGYICGQPLFCGLSIDGSFDTTHIDHIHFWPYWTTVYRFPDGSRTPGSYVLDWMVANGDAVHLFRVDGFQTSHIFCFGYRSGLRLSYSGNYAPNGGVPTIPQIGSLYPDACRFGVWFDGDGGSAHIQSLYTGGENLDNLAIPGGFAIYFEANNCQLCLSSARLFFTDSYAVVMDQPGGGNQLLIGNLDLSRIDQGPELNPTAMFSANATVPNIISIANVPMFTERHGMDLINNCTAWVFCPTNPPDIQVPVSGGTVTVGTSRDTCIIEPAGALGTLTINLPDKYLPGAELTIVCTQDIQHVTWASAAVIVAPPFGMVAGQARRVRYLSDQVASQGTNAWFFF